MIPRLAIVARCLLVVGMLSPTCLLAHVMLDSPLGGESLTGGDTYDILWHPTVGHGPVNWDLAYLTSGDAGPWTDIAVDLIENDPSDTDTQRSFSWSVPSVNAPEAWVRVVQDNQQDRDYESISPASFSIAALGLPADYNHDGSVDAADYALWRNGDPAADGNNDGAVNQEDYEYWRSRYGSTADAVPQPATAAPEPAAMTLGALALLTAFAKKLSCK